MAKDKKTLLITGGLGYIGSNLAKRLCDKFGVVIVDHDKSPNGNKTADELRRKGIQVEQSDITSLNTWIKIPACKSIFHASAQVSAELSWEKPELDFKINAYGTSLVAEYARRNNSQLIYCNTIRVYDPDAIEAAMKKHGKVSEDCPTIGVSSKPQPPFALSKYIGEYILQSYSRMYGMNVISHRMSGIVGRGQVGSKTHGWLSNIVRCAVNKEKFTKFGDGNQTRDVMHISEFIDLIENELQDFKKFSEDSFAIYNVGGGPTNELSINQVIKTLEKELSCKMKVEEIAPRIGEPKRYVSDIEKIRKKGYNLNIIDQKNIIIKELIDWYNSEG